MTLNITLKALLIWIGILLVAILNGAIRETLFISEFGKISGFVLSGVLLSICILFITYMSLPWIGHTKLVNYVLIGFGWLCITILFEFALGHIQGKPWSQLFEAYAFKDGNIWPIVLLVTAVAPYLCAKVRGWD